MYYGGGTTEAMSCRDEDVYVVGGANSAGQAAMFFSNYARRVVMLVRGPSLKATMSQYLIEQIQSTPNIDVQVRTRPVEVHGETHLESISIACDTSGEIHRVPGSAMFIFIGAQPRTDWLDGTIQRDEHGFILTGPDLMRDRNARRDGLSIGTPACSRRTYPASLRSVTFAMGRSSE